MVTAGIAGEQYSLNVESSSSIEKGLAQTGPTSVICTVGVNCPDSADPGGHFQMATNYHGVMALLDCWMRSYSGQAPIVNGRYSMPQFVAISSNSAHVARTNSRGYCASKAALSMGIRCTARGNATRDALIYAWEFGLLEGTPMTEAVAQRLGAETGLTRMPGHPRGQGVDGAARMVVDTYRSAYSALNGCTLRVDGGDQ